MAQQEQCVASLPPVQLAGHETLLAVENSQYCCKEEEGVYALQQPMRWWGCGREGGLRQ